MLKNADKVYRHCRKKTLLTVSNFIACYSARCVLCRIHILWFLFFTFESWQLLFFLLNLLQTSVFWDSECSESFDRALSEREIWLWKTHFKSNHTCPTGCMFGKWHLFNLYMKAQSATVPLSIGYLPADVPWSVTCALFIHAMTVNSQGKSEHRFNRTAKALGYILIPSLAPLPAAHSNS